jgi:hypothetical protein
LFLTAAALWNCSGKNVDCSRVFHPEDLYRQRGGIRGSVGPPHHGAARGRGRATPW